MQKDGSYFRAYSKFFLQLPIVIDCWYQFSTVSGQLKKQL